MSPSAPKPDALRQRRRRDHRRAGSCWMRGWVETETLQALIANGWVSQKEASDPDRLGEVLADVVNCWARGHLKPRHGV